MDQQLSFTGLMEVIGYLNPFIRDQTHLRKVPEK